MSPLYYAYNPSTILILSFWELEILLSKDSRRKRELLGIRIPITPLSLKFFNASFFHLNFYQKQDGNIINKIYNKDNIYKTLYIRPNIKDKK